MASYEQIEDLQEYDFGADLEETSASISGKKRSFENLDDDEDDIFAPKKANLNIEESAQGVATGLILSLRERLKKSEEENSRYQMQLEDAKSEIQRWQSAFQHEGLIRQGTVTDPSQVVSCILTLRSSETSLREQLEKAKKKEGAFILALGKREKELADLTSAIRNLRAQLRPTSKQARTLLLDPAIHEEFTRLKKLAEEKDRKNQELQDDIFKIKFNRVSEEGKALIAKCKKLQEENEQFANEANEGRIHLLSMKLSMQRSQNAQLRNNFHGLSKQMERLTGDVDRSNELMFILQEELKEKDAEIQRLRKHAQPQPDSSSDEQNALISDVSNDDDPVVDGLIGNLVS